MSSKAKKRFTRKTRRQRGGSISTEPKAQCEFPRHQGNTYIFFHIYCNDNTFDVVRDQVTKIIFSGLYQYVDQIYCCLAGNRTYMMPIVDFIGRNGKKFKILKEESNDNSYERLTLQEIPSRVKAEDKFLYIHTKGVGRHGGMKAENVWWWRNWMEYNLIYRFRECITELNKPEVDLVGVAYTTKMIGPHFSGNFWWMKGSYSETLPRDGNKLAIGDKYNDPESFAFKGKDPKYVDMDNRAGNLDLYSNTFMLYKMANSTPPVKIGGRRRRRVTR